MTYNIEITKMEVLNTDTLTDYVTFVAFDYTGVDGTYSHTISQVITFETDNDNIIPFADLTEDIVKGWITDSLPQAKIDVWQKSIAKIIELQKNPPTRPTNKPLPWS